MNRAADLPPSSPPGRLSSPVVGHPASPRASAPWTAPGRTLRLAGLLMLSASLFLSTTACKQQPKVDPLLEATTSYKTAVEPALARSEAMARIFVQTVTESQGKPDPDKAAARLESELLPKAREFSDQVNAIQVTEPQVHEAHQYLVRVAKLRLEGYEQVVKGYKEKNLDVFSEGQKKLRDSKIEEEEFSTRALQLMHSQGLELAIFTQGAVQ